MQTSLKSPLKSQKEKNDNVDDSGINLSPKKRTKTENLVSNMAKNPTRILRNKKKNTD